MARIKKDNKIMLLYHFSNKDFKILKPSFFGINHYSKNEREACNIKRSFCYDTEKPLENTLEGSKYRYTIKIKEKDIYNLDIDKFDLKNREKFNIYRILKHIIFARYQGISYTTSFKCYCLFRDIKPIKQDILY